MLQAGRYPCHKRHFDPPAYALSYPSGQNVTIVTPPPQIMVFICPPMPPSIAGTQRAKAEARAAADQERMDRLREDVLGNDQDAGAVEAKTASWQKFTSTIPKRKQGFTGRRDKTKRSETGVAAMGLEGPEVQDSGGHNRNSSANSVHSAGTTPSDDLVGGGRATGEGDSAEPVRSRPEVGEEKRAGAAFVCWVCRRGFKSAKGLAHHEAKSELHVINVQLREFLSPC